MREKVKEMMRKIKGINNLMLSVMLMRKELIN